MVETTIIGLIVPIVMILIFVTFMRRSMRLFDIESMLPIIMLLVSLPIMLGVMNSMVQPITNETEVSECNKICYEIYFYREYDNSLKMETTKKGEREVSCNERYDREVCVYPNSRIDEKGIRGMLNET